MVIQMFYVHLWLKFVFPVVLHFIFLLNVSLILSKAGVNLQICLLWHQSFNDVPIFHISDNDHVNIRYAFYLPLSIFMAHRLKIEWFCHESKLLALTSCIALTLIISNHFSKRNLHLLAFRIDFLPVILSLWSDISLFATQ